MRYLGSSLLLCAAAALSGCAAGLVAADDPNNEVRLLSDTVATAPRIVLSAVSDEEPQPASTPEPSQPRPNAPVDEAERGVPPQAPVTAVEWTVDDEPATEATASDVTLPVEAVVPPAPDVAESDAHDTLPPEVAEPIVVPQLDEAARSEESPADDGPSETAATDEPPPSGPAVEPEPFSTPPVVIESAPLRLGRREADDLQVIAPPQYSAPAPFAAAPQQLETITTPPPAERSEFRPGEAEDDHDRFSRQVADVPIDIRPTEGAMPADLAAAQYDQEPTIDETFPGGMPPDVFLSYTPWTFCYRPLYFEDIKLERYGENIGYAQTGLSGVRFFGSILALPYKMTNRPPRSCQCSNGFSRCGDCPLPGYGRREFRLDASLIEAAAVVGVVYLLP